MTGPYYLAIDGGGTNTRARLADTGGRIIGEGLSGSSNLTLGIETAGALFDCVKPNCTTT